jgi:PilZ domain
MSENRKITRRRVLKLGTIALNGDGGITCRIRDISEGGACLEVASQFGIPDEFKLVIGIDNWQRSCRVAWRKANRIGVAFD